MLLPISTPPRTLAYAPNLGKVTPSAEEVNPCRRNCSCARTLTPLICARILSLYGRGANQCRPHGARTGDGVESGTGRQPDAARRRSRTGVVGSPTEAIEAPISATGAGRAAAWEPRPPALAGGAARAAGPDSSPGPGSLPRFQPPAPHRDAPGARATPLPPDDRPADLAGGWLAHAAVPAAVFREQEDAQGYLQVLHQVVRTKGIPLGLYVDHHGIFQRHGNGRSSLEDELEASPVLTQVGRALQELGIQLIFAQSPQAKGSVERLWGTLQDRLGSELRLAQVTSLPEANQLLARYLQRFNRQFAVPARDPTCAYEPVPVGLKLDRIFCFKYERLVHADNTVRFDGREIQLLPLAERRSWVRARVEVHEHFDGAIAVYYRNTRIPSRAAPASATTIRARIGPRFGAGLPEPPAPPSPPRGALPSPKPAWTPPRTPPWKMPYATRSPTTGTQTEHA